MKLHKGSYVRLLMITNFEGMFDKINEILFRLLKYYMIMGGSK